MRKFLLTMATAASALAVTSCSDVTGIGRDVAGSYELRTLNGQSLPADDQFGETVEAGVLDLRTDGTFVDVIQYRTFDSPLIQEREFFGTWERNGDQIRLEYNGGGALFAERTSSGRLTLEDRNGDLWAYQRF